MEEVTVAMDSYEKKRAAERKEYGGYDKYEVESWAETLTKAGELLADPKKMAAVSKCLAKKEAGIRKLKDLKKLATKG